MTTLPTNEALRAVQDAQQATCAAYEAVIQTLVDIMRDLLDECDKTGASRLIRTGPARQTLKSIEENLRR